MADKTSGAVSASLIILVLVATAIGAIVALLLSGLGLESRIIAIVSGFIATVIASIVRYKIMYRGAGRGADESRIPSLVLTYAAIASIAGSLAAHDLFGAMTTDGPLVMLGALAGLLSAVLMAMLMITYHTNSDVL